MTYSQRNFVLIALLMILVSTSAGAIFAFSVEHETLLKLREQYESAFVSAAANDLETASASLQHAEKLNYRYVRMIDSHTHIIKLSTLLLLVSLLIPGLGWRSNTQWGFALTLATGSILFPSAILLQVYVDGILFKAIAGLGALMVIGSMTMLVITLFRKEAA